MKSTAVKGAWVLVSLTALAAGLLLLWGGFRDRTVLDIGNGGHLMEVSKGDVFAHAYLQSMYDVTVTEQFRIEDGYFRLIRVVTDSEAVLIYLGLERNGYPTADSRFVEFSVPLGSIGNHRILIHDRDISLGTSADQDGRITVRLRKMTLFERFIALLRG